MFEKLRIKNMDNMTKLLSLFIFFIFILFTYLIELNKDIQNYSLYSKKLNELNIDAKDLDNFLLKEVTFSNYDEINSVVDTFEKNIEFLDLSESHQKFSIKYKYLLKDIIENFKILYNSVEYYKSQSSQLLYSLSYSFELNKVIVSSQDIDKSTVILVNDLVLSIVKYYLNSELDTKKIYKKINDLELKLDNNSSMELKLIVKHTKVNLIRLEGLNKIQKIQDANLMNISLKNMSIFLDEDYQKNIIIKKIIVFTLFLVVLIILMVLIISHIKAVALKKELLAFKVAVENSYNSIVMTDTNSCITYANEMAIKDTGYTLDELIGENPRVLKSGDKSDGFYKEMHETLNRGDKWEGEFINKRKDGSEYYEKASIMPVYRDGKIANYLAIKLNITEYINEKNKAEYIAYHDGLTSLPNRRNIEESLKQRIAMAKRENQKIAFLFIDLDRFKTINDTLGHDIGDELLIKVAQNIQSALRESDMMARIGGDEFLIAIEIINNDYSAAIVAQNILDIFQEPIKLAKHQLSVTLSIGISLFPDDGEDYNNLLKHADIAMYEAKNNGKNGYRYYEKELSEKAHNYLQIEQALHSSIQNNELYMVYQPKYTLKEKNIIGLEALVRWSNIKNGFIGPDKFIPIAEETGYIIEIGDFVFKKACEDFLIFKDIYPRLETISINISTIQLHQNDFMDKIIAFAYDTGIDISSICLEITETHIMKNIDYSIKVLERLKDKGFKISIDDFGTGHSSLSYLKKLPIDELKIDKSFIDDLPKDKDAISISKAIISLSQSMHYLNVAEGIENENQEKFLLKNGCAIGQGYYFCKPKTDEDLIEFLKTK